jgi:hypothetical protein
MTTWLTRVWRRLAYCRHGHAFMFERTPRGLTLVCAHCLTTHLVFRKTRSTTEASHV